MDERPRVLAIVGPTGTGKTELACEVARRVDAEIISVDSMQVYRGMDIGTAKPLAELRKEIPHHGIDLVAPDEPMSAGIFSSYARDAARGILRRGRRVLLCGGTGLYARAFAGGLVGGISPDPEIRRRLRERTLEELRAELETSDPVSAQRIQPRDRVRIERALEVQQLVARPLSAQQAEHRFGDRPFDVRWLGLTLEREQLWERLRRRVEEMFQHGLVAEVRRLHAEGYAPTLRPLQGIGYREIGLLLAGKLDESEAREAIFVATRQYARRQRTWFRTEPGLIWLDSEERGQALAAALEALDAPPTGAGEAGGAGSS